MKGKYDDARKYDNAILLLVDYFWFWNPLWSYQKAILYVPKTLKQASLDDEIGSVINYFKTFEDVSDVIEIQVAPLAGFDWRLIDSGIDCVKFSAVNGSPNFIELDLDEVKFYSSESMNFTRDRMSPKSQGRIGGATPTKQGAYGY